MAYRPRPLKTDHIVLSDDIIALTERLAKNTHEVWARGRMADGWTYGPVRDDAKKQHPGLVPYAELSEEEKQYDRNTAMETIKVILAMGYRIERS